MNNETRHRKGRVPAYQGITALTQGQRYMLALGTVGLIFITAQFVQNGKNTTQNHRASFKQTTHYVKPSLPSLKPLESWLHKWSAEKDPETEISVEEAPVHVVRIRPIKVEQTGNTEGLDANVIKGRELRDIYQQHTADVAKQYRNAGSVGDEVPEYLNKWSAAISASDVLLPEPLQDYLEKNPTLAKKVQSQTERLVRELPEVIQKAKDDGTISSFLKVGGDDAGMLMVIAYFESRMKQGAGNNVKSNPFQYKKGTFSDWVKWYGPDIAELVEDHDPNMAQVARSVSADPKNFTNKLSNLRQNDMFAGATTREAITAKREDIQKTYAGDPKAAEAFHFMGESINRFLFVFDRLGTQRILDHWDDRARRAFPSQNVRLNFGIDPDAKTKDVVAAFVYTYCAVGHRIKLALNGESVEAKSYVLPDWQTEQFHSSLPSLDEAQKARMRIASAKRLSADLHGTTRL